MLAETDDGTSVQLVRNLREIQQARYIERVIEDHLAIENDPGRSEA